jgi:hypothetical protein
LIGAPQFSIADSLTDWIINRKEGTGNDLCLFFILDNSEVLCYHESITGVAPVTIVKEIRQKLTYSELDRTINHLWSVLFTTGYLTQHGREGGKKYRLAIPNREIRELFVEQIREWFYTAAQIDTPKLDAFCDAFPAGDADNILRKK